MPRMRNDEEAMSKQEKLDATMSVFAKIRRTESLKDVLHPPITRTKPLTFTNLFATSKEDTMMPPVSEETTATGSVPPSTASTSITNASTAVEIPANPLSGLGGPSTVKRKPCPVTTSGALSAFNNGEPPKFDPHTPRFNPGMHRLAKSVLKHRYTTKFTLDFEPPKGVSRHEYDFIWVTPEELERKVMEDIVWVRERYAQAGRDEPDCNDIIFWYTEEDIY
ncbi:hypothetical protein ONS95_003414 [Cadophora gregata]|uniref:uncharacterized protein n=1 Tax=Cadophora gregata TaxID=51156 RepID=UPI0026DD07A4|nr:uncharacterized protein ONS95_003414 [Cadophora gregata]KAK0108619.1 hypothetical protein ONS95_003414 [Cadophora gregata]